MAEGNRHLAYKEALNTLEQKSPGAKANFLFSFLERGHERFVADAETERGELTPCTVCGSPTTGEVCAFCRMGERVRGRDGV
jgi:recombinational DNA repair protein RecR